MKHILLLFSFIYLVFGSQTLWAVTNIGLPEPEIKPPLKLLNKNPNQPDASSPPKPPLTGFQPSAVMAEDIRDIQGPILLPESKNPWLIIGLAALAVIVLVLAYLYFKRRKRSVPGLPPHETALAALTRAQQWMNETDGLLFAQHLSEILRRYIESRFGLSSTRQTTYEFFLTLQTDSTPATAALQPHLGSIRNCLESCDMAKFAHLVPNKQTMDEMAMAVKSFIEMTKPVQPTGEKK